MCAARGGGGHTKGLTTDISWKLLGDVSAHQRTAPAIVELLGRRRSGRPGTDACFSIFSVFTRETDAHNKPYLFYDAFSRPSVKVRAAHEDKGLEES